MTGSPVPLAQTASSSTILDAWVNALQERYPNLPLPIARAMAEAALRGPFGFPLEQIDQCLKSLGQDRAIASMTGSELQMLAAVLAHLESEVHDLSRQVAGRWHKS